MPEGSWTVAQPLLGLRDAINKKWPNRLKSTDGFIGDAAHFGGVKVGQKPGGEHVPTDEFGYYRTNGVVRAGDYDVRRPDGSEFGNELVALLIADGKKHKRIAYIIYEGKIYSRNSGWLPRANSGHAHWVHVSFLNEVSSGGSVSPSDVLAAAANTAPWFVEEGEVEMSWPKCMPFSEGQWLEVSTAAGLKARYGPGTDAEVRTTVAKGYRVKVKAAAFVDDIWWVRGGTYWYGVGNADGSRMYLKKV